MPLSDTLQELVGYNDWAGARLMMALATAGDAALDRCPPGLGGPARALVHHIWAAERLWLDRYLGRTQALLPPPEDDLPLATLGERFAATDRERDAFFARLDVRDQARHVTYVNRQGETWTYPLGDMVLHVVNHGIYHRAQVVSLLRDAGIGPLPPLDYLFLCLARPTLAQEPQAVVKLREDGIETGDTVSPARSLSGELLAGYGRHGDWAQAQVLGAAASLSSADLDRGFGFGPGGTLRKTLLHVRDAEQHWLETWAGRKAGAGFEELPADTPLDALADLWADTAHARSGFLAALADDDLERPVAAFAGEGLALRFRIGESALQLRMHGTHHRAQAGMMLRALGASLPPLDYLNWYDETQPRLPPVT